MRSSLGVGTKARVLQLEQEALRILKIRGRAKGLDLYLRETAA